MATYIDELVQKITTKADLKGFDELDRKQKRAVKQNNLLARSFRNAFGMFLGIQGIRSIVEVSRKFDLMQKSIHGLTKSAEDFKYLRREAYRTGTDLLTIAGSYKNFYSAATGVGFGKGQVQGIFSDVLTAGRGIGASQSQIGAALLALEQMLSKGKVSAQELRLQMGNALPGAFEIAARAMNVTTAELDKMMSKGELASTVFVPKFAAQLKKELGGGFEEATKSLDFALVNLSTAWQEFQAEILQGESGQALAGFVKELTSILRSQEVLNAVRLLGRALGLIVKNIKLILLIFGAKKIIEYAMALRKLHLTLLAMAATTKALGTETRTLVVAYQMLTSGKIIAGIKGLSAGLTAMLAPIARLSLAVAGLVSWLLIAQDLWMFLTDPQADTVAGQFKQTLQDLKDQAPNPNHVPFTSNIGGMSPELVRKVDAIARQRGGQPRYQKGNDGLYYIKDMYGGDPRPLRGGPTGGAAGLGYMGDLPSLGEVSPATVSGVGVGGSFTNSNANNQNVQVAINIYPQQGQNAEDIGNAIINKLGSVLDNYVMVS